MCESASITRVFGPAHLNTASSSPTATMRPSLTATASAVRELLVHGDDLGVVDDEVGLAAARLPAQPPAEGQAARQHQGDPRARLARMRSRISPVLSRRFDIRQDRRRPCTMRTTWVTRRRGKKPIGLHDDVVPQAGDDDAPAAHQSAVADLGRGAGVHDVAAGEQLRLAPGPRGPRTPWRSAPDRKALMRTFVLRNSSSSASERLRT